MLLWHMVAAYHALPAQQRSGVEAGALAAER
jgi:hypothetical protein